MLDATCEYSNVFKRAGLINAFVRHLSDATREHKLKKLRHFHLSDRGSLTMVRKSALSEQNGQSVRLRAQKGVSTSFMSQIITMVKLSHPRQTPALLLDVPPGGASHWPSTPSTQSYSSTPVSVSVPPQLYLPTKDPFVVLNSAIKLEDIFLMDSDTVGAEQKGVYTD